MSIDWTVSVSNILTMGVMFAGFVAAHFQNIRRIDRIEHKLDMIFKWWTHAVIDKTVRHSREEERCD